ncbi:hypothetical protein V6N13_125541 [Hibiscus sabdariffa]
MALSSCSGYSPKSRPCIGGGASIDYSWGLGFRHLQTQNEVFLMKIAFNIIVNKEALLVRFLQAKYNCTTILPDAIDVATGSRLWKGLSVVWYDVRNYVRKRISNGRSTDFWRNSCIYDIDPLICYVLANPIPSLGVEYVAMCFH